MRKSKKLNIRYTRLISFRVSRVSGVITSFTPGSALQGYSGGELLATCERFDRLRFEHHTSCTSYERLTTCHICPVEFYLNLAEIQLNLPKSNQFRH